MAFLERLKLRRSALAPETDAPRAAFVAPKLKLRIDRLSQLFAPNKSARKLAPAEGLEAPPDPATVFTQSALDVGAQVGHGHLPLDERVWNSAQRIYERPGEMNDGAQAVFRAVGARIDGAVSLVAWTARLFIGLIWIALGGQLAAARLFGPADATSANVIGLGAVPASEWLTVTEIFGIAGAAAVLAAFTGAAMIMFGGSGDNRVVRSRAESLGHTAADLAREFDANLDDLRRSMDERQRPVEAVSDLSQSHLTAVEAAVFFRNIQFVTDIRDAQQKFVGYLRRSGPSVASGDDEIRAFLLGALSGGGIAAAALGGNIEIIDIPALSGISNPFVEVWIIFGALLYLFAGLLADGLRWIFQPLVADGVYKEALEAFRSGYVSRKPPRIEDVVRRINDALEVYKARVGRGGASQSSDFAAAADDTPPWRKGPEAPRFVEAGFQAAPKSFRADPPADKKRPGRKIF